MQHTWQTDKSITLAEISAELATILCEESSKIWLQSVDCPDDSPIAKSVYETIGPILYLAAGTVESVAVLSMKSSRLRDCYPLARSVFESVVNASFILAEGEAMAEKAKRHALQKAFRGLDREATISNRKISLKANVTIDAATADEIETLKAEFTSSAKQREITEWAGQNVPAKLSAIQAAFGASVTLPLDVAFVMIYRWSSEVIHGTFAGASLVFTGGGPFGGNGSEKLPDTLNQHAETVNLAVSLSAIAALRIYAECSGDAAAKARSEPLLKRIYANNKKTGSLGAWQAKIE